MNIYFDVSQYIMRWKGAKVITLLYNFVEYEKSIALNPGRVCLRDWGIENDNLI